MNLLSQIIVGFVAIIHLYILGFEEAIFPLKNPALISFPMAFLVGIVVSLLQPDKKAQQKFDDEKLRTYLGIGSE